MVKLERFSKCEKETVLYTRKGLSLVKITASNQRFNDVISIREEHSCDAVDLYDDNASIYVLYQEDLALGTIRVIEARASDIDFEEALPFKIQECFRPFICSASRLAITQRQNVSKSLVNFLVGVAAQDQLSQGTYFDLIVCRERLIPYYRRIGHQLLPYPPIIHPRTKARCHIMLWIMTLRATRLAKEYLAHLPDTLEVKAFEFLTELEGDPSQFLLHKELKIEN